MNRSLLLSVHVVVSAIVVVGLVSIAVVGGLPFGRAHQGERAYLEWSGWVTLALFLAAYAYVLRKYAHKKGYSPEFAIQVQKGAMEGAEQRIGALRDRIAARALTDRRQVEGLARAILSETGTTRVLAVSVSSSAAGGLQLVTRRTQPLGRMARWMHAHVGYGIGAGVLTFVHGGGHFATPMGVALNGLTLVVVATGLVGLAFWMLGPSWLTREERDLSIEEAFALDRHYARRIEAEIARTPAATDFLRSQVLSDGGALDRLARDLGGGPEGKARADDLSALRGQRRRVGAELARLGRVRLVMNAWRWIHVPASIVLFVVIWIHVVSVWLY